MVRRINILSPGERMLLRAAWRSFRTRLKGKLNQRKRKAEPRTIENRPPEQKLSAPVSTLPWIYLLEPSATEDDVASVIESMGRNWNDNSPVRNFEEAFARYVGTEFSLATSSCTGALHLALTAMGIKSGDEVIVPEITWVATASAVTYCGAAPVPVDVDRRTWCMDPAATERAINERTKAILPVHGYGHPADMPAIMKLAEKNGLKVIEDAAGALGATIGGKQVGSIAHAAAFSFHSTKVITSGEGGMVVCQNDQSLQERIRSLARHGQDLADPIRAVEIGFNYKMSNLQAALGLAQLRRLDFLLARKRQVQDWYRQRLGGIPQLALREEQQGMCESCWVTAAEMSQDVRLEPRTLTERMRQRQISVQPISAPLSSMPMFQRRFENSCAYQLSKRAILLPSSAGLSEGHIDRICSALIEVLHEPA